MPNPSPSPIDSLLEILLTYIPHWEMQDGPVINEWTWNKNIAANITSTLYFGLSHQNIKTIGSSISIGDASRKETHQVYGAFLQYDFKPAIKKRLFAELSFNQGNYCTCGLRDPYKLENIRYFGIGGGADFPLIISQLLTRLETS